MSGKLTAAQRVELERLRDLKMPESFRRRGFAAFPFTVLDTRSIEPRQRRGLVEGKMHEWTHPGLTGPSRMPRYRPAPAGRAALKEASDNV